MPKTVETVLGPIGTDKLGFCLMHEHLVTTMPGVVQSYPQLLAAEFRDKILRILKHTKQGGVDTIVDATPFDLGRNIPLMRWAAENSGINIIASTGWYRQLGEFHKMLPSISPGRLAGLFISDIVNGMDGTDVKAGVIKGAVDREGMTPQRATVIRAIGIAQKETGAPVMLHSDALIQIGRAQITLLAEEGADLTRVKIDHCLDTTDIDYLKWIMDQGCYIGLDRLPAFSPPNSYVVPLEKRLETVKTLINDGYANRLLFGHDGIISGMQGVKEPKVQKDPFSPTSDGMFLYVKDVFIPALIEMGVSESVLNEICTVNPRRFFEGS